MKYEHSFLYFSAIIDKASIITPHNNKASEFKMVIFLKYDGSNISNWAGESTWRAWRADLARFKKHGYSGWGSEGFWALTIYRLQQGLEKQKPQILWSPFRIFAALIKKILTLFTHINLHPAAKIGPGLLIPHVGPIQVSAGSVIGADCAIHQVTTIGSGADSGRPIIGDHVYMGAHVCILGAVRVGKGAKIGAGAVVVTDIPPFSSAVGVPAKAVKSNIRFNP